MMNEEKWRKAELELDHLDSIWCNIEHIKPNLIDLLECDCTELLEAQNKILEFCSRIYEEFHKYWEES